MRTWKNIKNRSSGKYFKNYSDKNHNLTKDDFFNWAKNNKEIWDSIIKSGESPSVDRINNSLGYSIDNIQMISQKENFLKGRVIANENRRKMVVGKSLKDGKEIILNSQTEGKIYGFRQSDISRNIAGKRKSAYGYVWRFA